MTENYTIRTILFDEADESAGVSFVVKEFESFNEVMRISFKGGHMTVQLAPHVTMDAAARAFLLAVARGRVN